MITFAHTGICVADMERAIAFYSRWFGFVVGKRFDKPALQISGAVLSLGDTVLEVLAPYTPMPASCAGPTLVDHLRPLGANHLAFSVSDCAALFDAMTAAGVAMVSPLIDGKMFFCKDADGTLIEVRI